MATKTTNHNGKIFTGVAPKDLPARCMGVSHWRFLNVRYQTGYDPKTGQYVVSIPGKEPLGFDTPKERDDWAKRMIRLIPKRAA